MPLESERMDGDSVDLKECALSDEELVRQHEMEFIRQIAQNYSRMLDASCLSFAVEYDPLGTLMKINKDLRTQGWKTAWICGPPCSPKKRVTVFPPGQEPEPRGELIRPGTGTRRYHIYMDLE